MPSRISVLRVPTSSRVSVLSVPMSSFSPFRSVLMPSFSSFRSMPASSLCSVLSAPMPSVISTRSAFRFVPVSVLKEAMPARNAPAIRHWRPASATPTARTAIRSPLTELSRRGGFPLAYLRPRLRFSVTGHHPWSAPMNAEASMNDRRCGRATEC